MDRVIGVSWPRSGHHLLVRLLQLYFGEGFGYCDYYGGVEGCCKTLPCTRKDIHFTKSHDFGLTLPQLPGRKYLIQYRAFIPSVVSNYELFLLEKGNGPDSAETFYRFASSSFQDYRSFSRKWIVSDFAQTQQTLTYEQLIAWPEDSLAIAIQWIAPEETPDMDRVAQAVRTVNGEKVERQRVERLERVGVHAERDITQFRHYRETAFERLAALQLTRKEVIETFKDVLGRAPAEANILSFQCFDTPEALGDHLRASDEYRLRMNQSTAKTADHSNKEA